MRMTWEFVVRRLCRWLSQQDAQEAANDLFFKLYKKASSLPDLDDRSNFWGIMEHYSKCIEVNILRRLNTIKRGGQEQFARDEELVRVAAPADWSDVALEELGESEMFARFLKFLKGLRQSKNLPEFARRRLLEEQDEQTILREMEGLTHASYRRLVEHLNKACAAFCADLSLA